MTLPTQPVILCGGSGTRLWPLSRAGFPNLKAAERDELVKHHGYKAMGYHE